ncbi:MAG TPA: response regulator transcription factor [Terriglobales bacterium]|jgi:DNA-binding response OmpR family regulator|nr:response regulator transcription factor [Terriglobales bacterium]
MDRKGVAIFGEMTVDFDRMEMRRSGRIIPATALEFRILKFFVDNPHCVLSREELMQAAWPERERVNGRTVDNFVGHLRRKIEEDPDYPAYLQTVRGIGYKFVPFPCTDESLTSWHRGWTADGRPEMRSPVLKTEIKRANLSR